MSIEFFPYGASDQKRTQISALVFTASIFFCYWAINAIVIAIIYRYQQVSYRGSWQDAPEFVRSWSMYGAILDRQFFSWKLTLIAIGCVAIFLFAKVPRIGLISGLAVFLVSSAYNLYQSASLPQFAVPGIVCNAALVPFWLLWNRVGGHRAK